MGFTKTPPTPLRPTAQPQAGFSLDDGLGRVTTRAPMLGPVVPKIPDTPALPEPDVDAAAHRVMSAGANWALIKDDYDQRMHVFGKELLQGDASYQKKLVVEIVKRDPGAFESWLQAGRMDSLVDKGTLLPTERRAVLDGLDGVLRKVPDAFVRDSHDRALIGTYMKALSLDQQDDFKHALSAFSGLGADDMRRFIADPAQRIVMRNLTRAVQSHQDWYESQSIDLQNNRSIWPTQMEAPLQFSKDQLTALRQAFTNDNGLMTHGELLLAYPDRLERNEQITHQYHDMSTQMQRLLGADNVNWATFAQWASDEVGRNLQGTVGIRFGEIALGNPRYWLSVGNTKLGSDIGPAFQHFTETFKDGKNRDMSFEKFWTGLEDKWSHRDISYLDGNNDPSLDMKNAFKAYYDSMHLKDKESTMIGLVPRESLAERRRQLMLYGNTLIGFQEQRLIQPELENGLKLAPMIHGGVVNPWGLGRGGIVFHLPGGTDPSQARRLDTDQNVPSTSAPVHLNQRFITADGQAIELGEAMRARLGDLDPSRSSASHWESYEDRMGYIYHLFANYQQDPQLWMDPREAFAARATPLNNDPFEVVG